MSTANFHKVSYLDNLSKSICMKAHTRLFLLFLSILLFSYFNFFFLNGFQQQESIMDKKSFFLFSSHSSSLQFLKSYRYQNRLTFMQKKKKRNYLEILGKVLKWNKININLCIIMPTYIHTCRHWFLNINDSWNAARCVDRWIDDVACKRISEWQNL